MADVNEEYLKDQILKLEKLASIGMLSAGIAHEVRNPLNFVINFSRLSFSLVNDLRKITNDNQNRLDVDTVEEIKEITDDLTANLDKVMEHGNRALSIIHNILLQSHGNSGEFLPSDIQAIVHENIWLSYHAARAEDNSFNVSIVEDYPEGMPMVMVVPQELSRAVTNCINNSFYAVKEMEDTGSRPGYSPEIRLKVTIATNADGTAELRINITDNGIGMTPETKTMIFENFFTTKPAGKGTGLGMGIVRNIIEKTHHGTIELETVRNEGTSITFSIPVKTV